MKSETPNIEKIQLSVSPSIPYLHLAAVYMNLPRETDYLSSET